MTFKEFLDWIEAEEQGWLECLKEAEKKKEAGDIEQADYGYTLGSYEAIVNITHTLTFVEVSE